MVKYKINPLTGEFNPIPDSGTIINKLNPVTGEFNLTVQASSYKQIINKLNGEFHLRPNNAEKTVTGNRYIDLTQATIDGIVSLKAFGGQRQVSRNYIDSCVVEGKNELRNVPNGYVELEYIESTGTQYIDTGITPTKENQTKALVTFQIHGSLNTQMALGANSNLNHYGGGTNFRFCGKEITAKDNLKHTVILQNTSTERKFTFGGTEYSANAASLEYPFWLFGLGGTNYYSPYRVYECKMRENDVLVRDMIPCINTEGVIGMYDLVNDMFYGNQGSGEFIAGSVVDIPGYEMLEYIESTGTQYIDLGKTFTTDNVAVYVDFDGTNMTSATSICGSQTIVSPREHDPILYYNGTYILPYIGSGAAGAISFQYTSTSTYNGRVKVKLTNDSTLSVSVNGNIIGSMEPRTLYKGSKYALFGNYYNSTTISQLSKIKMYSCKIWDNNVLVRDLVPCINTNGVIGMYDIIGHQFLTNAGTGVFVAGDVLNSNPTPTSPKRLWNNNGYYTANGVSGVSTLTDSEGNVVQLPNLNDGDIVDVISGTTTQKYIVEILTGTETNWYCSGGAMYYSNSQVSGFPKDNYPNIYSTHFIKGYASIIAENDDLTIFLNSSSSSSTTNGNRSMKYTEVFTSVDAGKARLAEQYANGTPVINLLPIVTPISGTITAQVLEKTPIAYNGNVELDEPTVVETLHTEPTVKFPLDLEINNGNFKPINYVRQGERIRGNEYISGVDGKTKTSRAKRDITDFVALTPGDYKVYRTGRMVMSVAGLAFYNSNQEYLTGYDRQKITELNGIVSAPSGTAYMRISSQYKDSNGTIICPIENLGVFRVDDNGLYNTETIQNSISGDKVYAEPLLQDGVHNITTGEVSNTRGYYIFDGSEDIRIQALSIPNQVGVYWYNGYRTIGGKVLPLADMQTGTFMYSNYLKNGVAGTSSAAAPNSICPNGTGSNILMNMDNSIGTTADKVKQWLQQKLVEGNPLVVIYQLATPNTYTVETQDMSIPQGDSRIEIVEGQILDLDLEATYK